MPGWVLSPIAESDLAGILDYMAEQSGSQRVVDGVLTDFAESLETLAASPEIGFRRADLTGHDVRWWPVHSYLVVYDANARPLRVLRVIHGARDLKRLFQASE